MRPSLSQRLAGVVHVSAGVARGESDDEHPDEIGCCIGAAVYGPDRCTCWEPIYDLDQVFPLTDPSAPPTRAKCCDDCAYRKGSPEREDQHEAEALEDLGHRGVFACHQGMRRAVAYRHPSSGRVVPAGEGDYHPPTIGTTAYKADGHPAALCAGWAAFAKRSRPRSTA